MEDVLIIDATERMLAGTMSPEEKVYFEELRKNNPEVDKLVSEYTIFLQQMERQGDSADFRKDISEIRQKLISEGIIPAPAAKVIPLPKRQRKTIAVAASIAGIVSLTIASFITYLNSGNDKKIKPLVEKLNQQENKTRQIEQKVNQLSGAAPSTPRLEARFRATGFMIDATNNILVTNAHVINEAKNNLIVENSRGDQYLATVLSINPQTDIAILKITDSNFHNMQAVPYSFRKSKAMLGDKIFLLGYPKQEIVYGEGYISAMNGYDMDSVYYQLSTLANEGNSGSPVINQNGEVIGILSSMETNAEGVVYAIKSENLFSEIENLKDKDQHIRLPYKNSIKSLPRASQISKVKDYVYMVKGN